MKEIKPTHIRRLIIILYLLIIGTCTINAQVVSPVLVSDTLDKDTTFMVLRAGTCASPDGPMNPTTINPPSYAWLQTNGYCNPNAYGNNPTVCWTFTPTSSSVTINSGYSVSGCVNTAFWGFNLYDNTCTLVGTGLNFTGLTQGNQYTWCMTGFAWGGGPGCTGFDDFCPYYFNNTVLPVELVFFNVDCERASWMTASETNNDYFKLETSLDGLNWTEVETIDGAGTTNYPQNYSVNIIPSEGVSYYRLVQVDYDGNFEIFNSITAVYDCYVNQSCVYYNYLGQIVTEDYTGLKYRKCVDY